MKVRVRVRVRVGVGAGVRVRVTVRVRVRRAGPMHRGHLDDESEEVIHEGVERLVHECLPRHVRRALELIVDEELRRHHNETKGVHAANH